MEWNVQNIKGLKIENERQNKRDQLTKANLVKIIVTLIKRICEIQITEEDPELHKSEFMTISVNLTINESSTIITDEFNGSLDNEKETLSLEEKLKCAINKKKM